MDILLLLLLLSAHVSGDKGHPHALRLETFEAEHQISKDDSELFVTAIYP